MPRNILVVRLGAMGDVLHTLPAVATIRRSFPDASITWLVEPRWRVLLEGNPHVNEVAEFNRAGGLLAMIRSARSLRERSFDFGLDFQGLLKSAGALWLAGVAERWGSHSPREWPARLLYSHTAEPRPASSAHIVDQHLELARAAGAVHRDISFPLPPGSAVDGSPLPEGGFVLASPLAGWGSKQWPAQRYTELAVLIRRRLGLPLVLNLPPGVDFETGGAAVVLHRSGLPGLIHATRQAVAIVGVDSGPLHLAAALGKPGIAIFGPTDPARNGPYGGTLAVLRQLDADTTYKRSSDPSIAMRAVSAEEACAALEKQLALPRNQSY